MSDSENLNQEKSRISETIENKAKSNNFDPKQVNNLLVRGVAPREPIAEPVANGGIILENETLSINEMPEGLFYTVQIGAFSQEVKPLQFNRFKPLTAKKQASGQVRYSTGFYNSVDEARPKKAEVIAGGIKDAFITAYFNGERITIEEADKISKKKRETELTSTATNSGGVGTVKYVAFESEENLPERFVQLVSQQKFESYPKTIVSNLHGISNFYFDSIDHQIKSQFYLNLTALPDVQASAFVFDTVEVNRLEQHSIAKGTSLVSIQFKGTELTGELSNWLLRLSIPYCGIPTKDGVRLLFPVVENDQKQQLLVDLKQFKYTDYTEIQNR